MRLKRNRLKSLALKKLQVIKDEEGGTYEEFSSSFCIIDVEVWPATNKRQVELYGVRVNDILNVNYQGNTLIEVGDGLCVNVSSEQLPDYRVISKKEYTFHQVLEIEKI